MHGSPRMYASPYPSAALDRLAAQLLEAHSRGAETWCIFDNTASGAAFGNALGLASRPGAGFRTFLRNKNA
jgi:uncharacterized protein YecE (DUF72 family)